MKKFFAPTAQTELTSWMSDHMDDIRDTLSAEGIVLLRGFDTEDATTLKKTLGLFGADPMTDARWSTPRSSVGDGAFTSTEYPAEQWIVLHSEMSYARSWPRLLMFQCKTAAATGGATTIADLAAVSASLGEILDEFHEREVIYQRNFRKGLDIPWQTAFGTEDADEVLEIGTRNGLEIEWRPDGTLRTAQQAQGAVQGPDGTVLWFNQAHLFHPCQLPEATRKALVAALGADGLPRNAVFGDGEPIPDATIERILQVLTQHTENIDWQDGDLAIIDNMRWMHGRAPFTGTRKVLAAMGQPQDTAAVTPIFA
ncbi:TauD/TfdA family dioxygenase [Roseobacter sinensis]|uniref:TauD/TfdA family dioxygenase n=1 Tax=Roseobacter sinensis TaxID=2931391 RepID=A0ABT3BJN9_9RHOB|nr:TauD/TfdA family dioxygenase [Roseobacter sp. WL0113]MCV3273770.1 TauD/TfdA family dioxygenase [Roseobacter sp. WL0113]